MLKVGSAYSRLQLASLLQEFTCHSVTCHMIEMAFQPLLPSVKAATLFSDQTGNAELTY